MLRMTLLAITLFLTACTNTVMVPAPRVKLPAQLLTHCPDLLQLKGGTGADVLDNIVNNANTYYACRAKDDALVQAVK